MNQTLDHICSLHNCPSAAIVTETTESAHWRFTVYYCMEHNRQLDAGTPLGPLGLDPGRIDVESLGINVPNPQGNKAVSPQ